MELTRRKVGLCMLQGKCSGATCPAAHQSVPAVDWLLPNHGPVHAANQKCQDMCRLGCEAQLRCTRWSGLRVMCAVVSSRSALPLPIWAGLHCAWVQRGPCLHKRGIGAAIENTSQMIWDASASATVCLAGVCMGLH